ncbi:MAG TPA: hypothetical protein VI412_07120 [Tabrizicola sp.]|jgi:hypothetical protein
MTTTSTARLIREEADLLEAGVKLQTQGLDLLLAEMRALALLLPGAAPERKTDAEVEADFDNMPV